MFNSRFKKIVLTTVVAALLSSCNLAGVLKNQKNLFGRYYDGALNEKELKSFNPALAKAYTRVYRETNFKKPYIVGKCIADAVLSNLPRDAYQTFVDWQVLVAGTNRITISAIGNRLLLISDAALEHYNYDQNVIAYFIAHAVAHSELDHLNERMGMKEHYVSKPLEAFSSNEGDYVTKVMALAGEPADEKDLIHYTKELEDEADSMAMSLVAMAGFDPNNVFVYLNNHIDDDQGFYVKQHPITEKRVEYISTLLDNSVKLRDRAFKNGVHPQCSNIQ